MRITRRQLKRIIREEHEDWGMGKDEKSRTRPGEEDYTGHKGDLSKTHSGKDYEHHDPESRAHDAIAAIQDLAGAAGVNLDVTDHGAEDEVSMVAMESRRRRRGVKRLTERQIRRIIRQEKRRLFEDSISDELDNLKKNISDDLDHIKDLHKDIEDDRDEEERARDHRKDEALRRRIRRAVRESARSRRRNRR